MPGRHTNSRRCRLSSERGSDAMPYSVLEFDRRRTSNGGHRTLALPAGFDQLQYPHFAVGIIQVAAAVATGHCWPDSRDLIFAGDHSGRIEIGCNYCSFGVDVGRNVVRDRAGVFADADTAIEGGVTQP